MQETRRASIQDGRWPQKGNEMTKLLVVDVDRLKLHPNRILQQYGFDPAQWKVVAPGVGITGFRAEVILIDLHEIPDTVEEQRKFNDWMTHHLQTRLMPGGKLFLKSSARSYFGEFGPVPEEK